MIFRPHCRFLLELLLTLASVVKHFSHGQRSRFAYQSFSCEEDSRMVLQSESGTGNETFLFKTLKVKKKSQCSFECVKNTACLSYNIQRKTTTSTPELTCELLNITATSTKKANIQRNAEYLFFTSKVRTNLTLSKH